MIPKLDRDKTVVLENASVSDYEVMEWFKVSRKILKCNEGVQRDKYDGQ